MKKDLSIKVAAIIKPDDDNITRLAKMAANICEFAFDNPFHVDFEDNNFAGCYGWGPFAFNQNIEKWLKESKEGNCQLMTEYIDEVYNGVLELNQEQREMFWKKFNETWSGKMRERRDIFLYSRNDNGWCAQQKEDGIYWETNRGVEKVWPIEHISPEEYQREVYRIVNHKTMLDENKLKKLKELSSNYGF